MKKQLVAWLLALALGMLFYSVAFGLPDDAALLSSGVGVCGEGEGKDTILIMEVYQSTKTQLFYQVYKGMDDKIYAEIAFDANDKVVGAIVYKPTGVKLYQTLDDLAKDYPEGPCDLLKNWQGIPVA